MTPSHLPRTPRRLAAFPLVLALSACGGGSGGSPDSNGPPPRTNRPPTASSACVAVPTGSQSITATLPGSDPDGDALVYQITAPPANGQLNPEPGGRYTYTPYPNARGMDRFSYRALDPAGLESNVATITLLVDGNVRIMPLGDSITEGYYNGLAATEYAGYRRKLYADLRGLGYPVDFVGSVRDQGASASPPLGDLDHEGHGGWCDDTNPPCTANPNGDTIAANVEQFLGNNPPDIVLLHIGTNNFDPDPTGVQTILDRISNWATTNNPVSVFVARIIPALDGRAVTVFNDNVTGVAYDRSRTRVRMVDQQSVLALPGNPDQADPTLMETGGPGVHPNQAGYDRMADRWRLALISSGALPTCD